MNTSRSQYIELESISMKELFSRGPGSLGLYIPTKDTEGKVQGSITRISSAAKRLATHAGKRCVVSTLLVLKNEQGSELPTPSKVVQILVTAAGDLSPLGMRYVESNLKGGV